MNRLLRILRNLFKRKDSIDAAIHRIKQNAEAVVLDEHGNLDPDEHLTKILNAVFKTGGPVYGSVDKKGKLHMKFSKKGKHE